MPSMIKVAENKCCRWENRKSNFHLPPEIYLCIFNDFLFWRKRTDKNISLLHTGSLCFSLRTNFSLIVTVTKVHLPTRLVWFLWEVKWKRNDTSISFCREKPSAVFDNNWSIGNRHLTEGGVIETVEVIETNPFSFHFLLCHSSPTLFLWIYFDLNEKWGKPCDFLKWTEPTQIDWTKIQSGYQDLFLGTLAVRFTFWIYSIFLLFLF